MELRITAAFVAFFVGGLVLLAYRRQPRRNHTLEQVRDLVIDNNLKLKNMAGELQTLQTEVSETKTVIQSAVVLIQGLKARLDEAIASGDPAALTALSESLNSDQEALAAAIAANTPSEDDEEEPGEGEEPVV